MVTNVQRRHVQPSQSRRRLREGRSFRSAVLWTMPLVAVTHVPILLTMGAAVGVGLIAQLVLSLFSMYGGKGKAVLVLLFLVGAGLFGLAYVKVIGPQIQAEKDFVAQQAK